VTEALVVEALPLSLRFQSDRAKSMTFRLLVSVPSAKKRRLNSRPRTSLQSLSSIATIH
jgi:hypothetical protein